jgi:hypothetical protein
MMRERGSSNRSHLDIEVADDIQVGPNVGGEGGENNVGLADLIVLYSFHLR